MTANAFKSNQEVVACQERTWEVIKQSEQRAAQGKHSRREDRDVGRSVEKTLCSLLNDLIDGN